MFSGSIQEYIHLLTEFDMFVGINQVWVCSMKLSLTFTNWVLSSEQSQIRMMSPSSVSQS